MVPPRLTQLSSNSNSTTPHSYQGLVVIPPTPPLPDYRIHGLLSEGGMGRLWLATRLRDGLSVLIKTPIWNFGSYIERFLREVRILRGLHHPNVIAVLDDGRAGDTPYYVCRYHEGGDLRKRLHLGRIQPYHAAELHLDVSRGMRHAHERGIIHRDLAPKNVVLSAQGQAVVIDLGLSRFVDDESGLTGSGVVLGTAPYMAPEQVRGDTDKIDKRTDVWGLGILLYEMVVGAKPFRAKTWGALSRSICEDPPHQPPGRYHIPRELQGIWRKCLHKRRADRFADAGEVVTALERFLSHRAS